MSMDAPGIDQRILIWAAGRDAELTRNFLTHRNFAALAASDCSSLCHEITRGAGVLIIAEEMLHRYDTRELQQTLKAQPAWSDLPVIVVAQAIARKADPHQMIDDYGDISILHRPLSLDTLFSTVSAALRSRTRQFEVRDLLHKLQESERQRSEFLAMLAHELRNPLAPIRTGLQVMRIADSKETSARAQTVIERQVQNLSRLIDDLLEVTRVTQGKIQLKISRVSLQDILFNVVEGRTRVAAEKRIAIDLEPIETPLLVEADATRLEQVVDNVLSNAVKFTPEGGQIHISARAEGSWVLIRVRDTGVGIDPEMLESVFDLFTQTHQTIDRAQGGLGIGLTVVKTLVELHGGTVRALSEGRDRGTEVRICLPLRTEDAITSESSHETIKRGRTRRVLLVEDNRDTAQILATYLRVQGHTVLLAYDGPSGLRAALREQPDVIICDIGLPGMDGFQLAREIRKAAGLQRATLVAVTGYGDPGDRTRGHSAGFEHYLVKPADPEELARLIA